LPPVNFLFFFPFGFLVLHSVSKYLSFFSTYSWAETRCQLYVVSIVADELTETDKLCNLLPSGTTIQDALPCGSIMRSAPQTLLFMYHDPLLHDITLQREVVPTGQ
jgi:hypothetical protein